MVELWPYAERSRGIAVFQLFGRLAGFFTTFVNPVGLSTVKWRYLISYCCFLAFEIVFVYLLFPETFGRTLEELAFCKNTHFLTSLTTISCLRPGNKATLSTDTFYLVFEDKALTDKAVRAVEKVVVGHDPLKVPTKGATIEEKKFESA